MNIAIIGRGRIGMAAQKMLAEEGLYAVAYDVGEYCMSELVERYDAFLAACPFEITTRVASAVKPYADKVYFDLTEDVAVGRRARENAKALMIPHCGLAPGAVSIIAKSFMPCNEVQIRVGALPQTKINRLGYSLTWSTNGLVNEYLKPCPSLIDGKVVDLEPLDGWRSMGIFESFNTSGGIGTLHDTSAGLCPNISYQTIRYNGHRNLMRFLIDDLGLGARPHDLVELLDRSLPRDYPDMVLINIWSEKGRYQRTILPKDGLSAIQRATAAGVVAVMLATLKNAPRQPRDDDGIPGSLRGSGWLANEDFDLSEVERFKCWRDVYGEL